MSTQTQSKMIIIVSPYQDKCVYLSAVYSLLTEKIVLLQLYWSYLKAVRVIAEIWNSVFTSVLKPHLQPEVTNHYLYTVQTVLNFAAGSFSCKITLIWLGSSLSVVSSL